MLATLSPLFDRIQRGGGKVTVAADGGISLTPPSGKKVSLPGIDATFGTAGVADQNVHHRYLTKSGTSPFAITVGGAFFEVPGDGVGPVYDDIMYWGYNAQNGAARINTSDAKLVFSLEANYHGAVNDFFMEWNLDYTNVAGTVNYRPLAFAIDRNDPNRGFYWSFAIGNEAKGKFEVVNKDRTQTYMLIEGSTSAVKLINPAVLYFTRPDTMIVPGSTSFAIRNSANTTNNLLIWDSTGDATFRGAVNVPNSIVNVASGAAATPTFTFSGDTDTGLYRVGPDRIAFATAGVKRGEIGATGNWFLGTQTALVGANWLTSFHPLVSIGSGQRPGIEMVGNWTTDGEIGAILFSNAGGGTNKVLAVIVADRSGANDAGSLRFLTSPSGLPPHTRLTIDPNGVFIFRDGGADLAFGTTTGTKIGTAPTQKLGFFGATPVVQPAAVADATGGTTIDAEARAAINALLARMRSLGLIAT